MRFHSQERNSSTLLFAALMTRLFGVARTKTGVEQRNAATAAVFFRSLPDLAAFLADRLRRATAPPPSGEPRPLPRHGGSFLF